MTWTRNGFSLARVLAVLPLLLGAVLLSGCSDPEKTAVESLEELRYAFSVDDYLLAAEAGDFSAVRLFHDAGMAVDQPDESGTTALMRAATGGRLELVESLLDGGADPMATNDAGRTPLMFAAEGGSADVVRLLLSRGGQLESRDQEGWTALKLAAFNGRADVVELLAPKVDEETLDQVLLVAAFKGDPAVIDQLLNHGAYINTRSPENLTPLMIAAQAGKTDAVKLLLQNRANPYAIDNSEKTAANLAEEAGHLSLSELLLDPTSILEVAENGGAMDDPLMDADPEMVESAIADALDALAGGESPAPEANTLAALSEEEPVDATMPIKSTEQSPRLASINGRTIGTEAVSSGGNSSTPTSTAAGNSRAPVEVSNSTSATSSAPTPAIENPVAALSMKDYREEPLPIMLKGVESDAETAKVRVLSSRDSAPVDIKQGEVIPGTSLKVASMDAKSISSKMGKGNVVDVSSIMVEDTRTGMKHLLVKDQPGRSSDTYATLTLPGSPFEYVVKNGDVFRANNGADGEQDFEVLDVRPTQVVIRNMDTEEVLTVHRDGIAMR